VKGWLLIVAAALCLASAGTAAAADENAVTRSLTQLQQRDETLQSIGWKLVHGNAAFCNGAAPSIGLLLQDVAAFSAPDTVRSAMDITGDIAVQAVASGSPAQAAGLPAFAEVLAINGHQMKDLPAAGPNTWKRLLDLHTSLQSGLSATGTVSIEWRSPGQPARISHISGVAACPGRFEVIAGSAKASANGTRVAIGEKFVGFTYPEELFAAAIAHELAHNILGHPAWLDTHGRKRSNVRLTEREADRMMPWLLANAGYDPAAAERFMRHWGPRNDGGLLRGRTHDGWDERADFIAAELPAIRQSMAESSDADGRNPHKRRADWATLFVRQGQP